MRANTARVLPSTTQFAAQWIAPDELDPAPWQALHDRALEPNPFYGPAIVLAAARHLPGAANLRLLTVRRGDALVGVLPLVTDRRRYLMPLPVLRAGEFYGPLSTPLLDPEQPDDIWCAMLDLMAGSGTRALLLPFLTGDGAAEQALDVALNRSGRATALLGQYRRAMLRSDLPAADYVRQTLETRRRKEAERQRRRLAERGELDFRVARGKQASMELEVFLDLEATGWKGKRGTDLKHAEGAADFIRDAVQSLVERDAVRVVSLRSGDHPVAAGIVVLSRGRAYYIKTAYDEAFARYSPGLLLTLDLTRHLLEDPAIEDADSVAIAGHPMIDPIWTGRQLIHARIVAPRPGRDPLFRLAVRLERLRERVRISTLGMRARF